MPDVFSKKKRSEVMSLIRSRGNRGTELVMVRLLREHGITGWRRHVRITGRRSKTSLEGKAAAVKARPDFVFREKRLAVFVDGCFWHGCPRHCRMPKGNRGYWKKKIEGNIERDQRVSSALRRAGWRVMRVWECELSKKNQGAVMRRLARHGGWIRSGH